MTNSAEPLLAVRDLRTYFFTRAGIVKAVDGVDFEVQRGEIMGLVGESGSGKSNVCLSIVNLVSKPAGRIVSGQVLLEGRDLLQMKESQLRSVRGREVSMILQDPSSSLNPVLTIGVQVGEAAQAHESKRGRSLQLQIIDALKRVQIPSAETRLNEYPHQFSGGMRQRVVTAMAVACHPKVILADEPTTALDVTTQSQFLALLRGLRESGIGIVYVTHDLGVVAEICDRVAVMYAGQIVESGSVEEIFENPQHPYTAGLIASVPALGSGRGRLYQIEGDPPDPLSVSEACRFAPRCFKARSRCHAEAPPLIEVSPTRTYRCWYPLKNEPELALVDHFAPRSQ
ncbi:MAG: ABC transporter ATP-binding protein [Dehalococcoidia bacterium]|nr:ABC transporter ATP-binding protein [Dehalococcoidia bacterium]MCA9845896.1 ABC transporter ATP-binding protein [Dehalococcoidia bacterium]